MVQLQFPWTGKYFIAKRSLAVSDCAVYVACGDAIATATLKPDGQQNEPQTGNQVVHLVSSLSPVRGDEKTQAAERNIPLRFRESLLDFGTRDENDLFDQFLNQLKQLFAAYPSAIDQLENLETTDTALDRHAEKIYAWEDDVALALGAPSRSNLVPLNQLKLRELHRLDEMKQCVADGVALCGLKLAQPSRVQLPLGLPVTQRMKKHGVHGWKDVHQVRAAGAHYFAGNVLSLLSSARSSLASSVLSSYRSKNMGDIFQRKGSGNQVSQQSSRKSSLGCSSLSPTSDLSEDCCPNPAKLNPSQSPSPTKPSQNYGEKPNPTNQS